MNTAIIKQWFNDYIESGDGKGWRKDYENTFNKVQEIKQKLNNGYKLSAQNDFEFLSELLKNDANGVASKGQSNLANEVFDKIIQDVEFLNVVEKLIQQPNEETYKALNSYGGQLLTQLGSTQRPLLFNRACASCTLDVSTIVDRNKFHQFVEYVTTQQILDFPQEIREKNWYVKNVYLVQKIREIFKVELESGQTDIFWLNMFLWDIYAEKVATDFNAKNAVDYLNDRYPNTYTSTKHIAAFKTSQGRELALDPKAKTPVIICDAEPPIELKLPIKKAYSEDDTRHHHLSTHAKSLMLGNKAYSIIVSNLDDLEKLCDWYEQSDDQTTALEKKVKKFLKLWPIEGLKNLSIQDYHQAYNKDCFIAQIDSFDPTQGNPTFANYFDLWEPISLGKDDKYSNEKPYSWHKRLGDNAELAFETLKQEILNILDAVQQRDLKAIDEIQFPKGLKWMIAFLYQDFNDPLIIPIVSKVNAKRIGYEHLYPKLPLPEFLPILLEDRGEKAFFPYVEKLFAMVRKGYLDNKQNKQQIEELMEEVMAQQPLNRILFGAAGTGKTYNTINHALAILENKDLTEIEKLEKQPGGRTKLKGLFDKHKNEGRIKFVTFHQSFSYEDFVEGIRAEVHAESDQLSYRVKPGVFKEICEKATGQYLKSHSNDNSLDSLLEEISIKPLMLKTIKNKEFKVSYIGHGHVIHCQPLASESNATYRANINSIREILQGDEPEILYNSSYVYAIANYIKQRFQPLEKKASELDPYVLIIDEINRGNISRIFGELITLIEDSKRADADEALSVTLPYSKKEFSVPSNVYIIGTMNSSDRSLTGLDIALRRRFTFIEMPPKPEEIKDKDGALLKIHGKDRNGNNDSVTVAELLAVINQRIEVLLDRDHCIGHANFMSLKEQPTLDHLTLIFKQKIIPQLQEYFFDDWAKINLVFFNNGMVVEDKGIITAGLFPPNTEQDMHYSEQKKIWKINDEAFKTIDAFISILGSKA